MIARVSAKNRRALQRKGQEQQSVLVRSSSMTLPRILWFQGPTGSLGYFEIFNEGILEVLELQQLQQH